MSLLDDPLQKIRRAAMNYLARRDYTAHDLRQKLRAKGHSDKDTNLIIDELVKSNALSEERFAEMFVRSRRARGYGPLRIAQELATRGASEDIVAKHVDMADNAWFEDAKRVWLKQFRGEKPQDYKTQAKHMRFLQYRGFTAEHINSVLKDMTL